MDGYTESLLTHDKNKGAVRALARGIRVIELRECASAIGESKLRPGERRHIGKDYSRRFLQHTNRQQQRKGLISERVEKPRHSVGRKPRPRLQADCGAEVGLGYIDRIGCGERAGNRN